MIFKKAIPIEWFSRTYYLTRKDNNPTNRNYISYIKHKKPLRQIENRKFRRDKFNISNYKKVWVAYRWNLW